MDADILDEHTSEELVLLLTYLSLIGIWFAIPSVSLMLRRDKRYHVAVFTLSLVTGSLLVAYKYRWRVLFPRSASIIAVERHRPPRKS